MRIALGADHRGLDVRRHILGTMRQLGHEVELVGDDVPAMCDYPDVAYPVALAVAEGRADRGVLSCGSGIGMCIAANKVRGVRAALVHDEIGADMSRRHNDANVLCLPADLLGIRIIDRILSIWLKAPFEGGRHGRRVAKIMAIEQNLDPRHTADAMLVQPAQDTIKATQLEA
ncbi:MAG: ribose 5-phosphate isomerase B [Phycisphaeraceae bacterium]